jgi:hypothetical protein
MRESSLVVEMASELLHLLSTPRESCSLSSYRLLLVALLPVQADGYPLGMRHRSSSNVDGISQERVIYAFRHSSFLGLMPTPFRNVYYVTPSQPCNIMVQAEHTKIWRSNRIAEVDMDGER